MKPVVYDRNLKRLGMLHHALAVGYTHVFNDLYTAQFSLPARDAENELCQGIHAIVEIMDGDRPAGKYRISEEAESSLRGSQAVRTYHLEHVLAFLLDDRIDGVLELGGSGVTTEQVIRYLLSLQSEPRWVLGQCDFAYQFQYSWEAEDLLSAIFSVPACFEDAYRWDYNTTTYPFTLNLLRAEDRPGCELRYGRNEVDIRRGRDLSSLCTRLYCLGSGEGVNQVNIREASANVHGHSYIDSPNIARYGVIARHYIDTGISNPDLLYEKGRALLHALEEPAVSYTIKAVDLYRRTGLDWDRMDEGRCIRIADPEFGIHTDATILRFSKPDVDGQPLNAEVVIANKPENAASQIEGLSARAAITAQYSQGATNLFPLQVMDNADPGHPARLKFFIPESCRRINQVLLSFTLSPFRAYSTGAASGGSENRTTSEGGESTQTSSSGGGSTQTSSVDGASSQTSSAASESKGTTKTRTIVETINTSEPIQEGTLGDYTGGTVDAFGNALNETGAASGQTGAQGEMNTGAPQNADGAMLQTGDTSGSTGSSGELTTGAARNGSGVMLETDSDGEHSHRVTTDTHAHYFSDSDSLSLGHTHYVYGDDQQTGGMSANASKTVSIGGDTSSVSVGGSTGKGGSHTHAIGHWHTLDGHRHSLAGHSHGMGHWHSLDAHSHSLGGHTHTLQHQHRFPHSHNVRVSVTIPSLEVTLEPHTHTVKTPAHSHEVTIPAHSHNVTIPAHSHSVSIPAHAHDIVYGIYEGTTASTVSVTVDGTPVPESALRENGRYKSEIDVVPYLRMSSGRILRGTWHEIELKPDRLTRIEANLFVQTFITSWNGGVY